MVLLYSLSFWKPFLPIMTCYCFHFLLSRFEESNSETSFSPEQHSNSWQFPKWNPNLSSVMSGVRRGFEIGSSRMKSLRKSLHSHSSHNDKPKSSSKKIILDPQGPFVQRWNKIFVLACVIAVSLDPLFFYIPVIDGEQQCLDLDDRLKIAACVLRSFTDLFYIFHIILQFRTGFISPSSRVFGRGELIEDPKAIAKRYLMSYFIVDVLAVLPLPQVCVHFVVNWSYSYIKQMVSLYLVLSSAGGNFNSRSLLKFAIVTSYKGPVEDRHYLPVCSKTFSDLSFIQGSYQDIRHIYWNAMGWSCF